MSLETDVDKEGSLNELRNREEAGSSQVYLTSLDTNHLQGKVLTVVKPQTTKGSSSYRLAKFAGVHQAGQQRASVNFLFFHQVCLHR